MPNMPKIVKKKKLRQLIENKEIIHYDKPEKPPLLFKHPDLHEYIHDCVEFGSADAKRRKEAIKVQTIENLHKNLNLHSKNYIKKLPFTSSIKFACSKCTSSSSMGCSCWSFAY